MSVNAIGSNPLIIESVKSTFEQGSVRKILKIDIVNDPCTFINSTNLDQKKSIVSKKLDHHINNSTLYLRYQSIVPIAKTVISVKTYNDTKKTKSEGKENEFCEFSYVKEDNETKNSENSSVGVVLYMLVKSLDYSKEYKSLKGPYDILREKLNKAYQIGFVKTLGTLVNLVF